MGIVVNCGMKNVYLSLINWAKFKNIILFETLRIIGIIYPELFVFIDEKLEITERINNSKNVFRFSGVSDTIRLKNISEDRLYLFPEMYIDYVRQNWSSISNSELSGIHELIDDKLLYRFENCRNIYISLLLLKTNTPVSHEKLKIYDQLIDLFNYSWENAKDIVIL